MDKLPLALQRLATSGHDFTLRQAVLLLESFNINGSVSYVVRPSSELSFPSGEIRRCWIDKDGRWVIEANVFALSGGGSPLPHYWIDRAVAEDPGGERLRALLKLINESVYAVLIDGWRSLDEVTPASNWFNCWRHLTVAAKLPTDRIIAPDLFCQRRASAYALKGLVQRISGTIAVKVRDRVHKWSVTEADGVGPGQQLGGASGVVLGEDFCLGGKAIVAAGQTQIEIGPLEHDAAVKLIPGSARGDELNRLVSVYLGPRQAAQVDLLIAPGERERWVIGDGWRRLGCTTWLGDRAARQSSLIFSTTTN